MATPAAAAAAAAAAGRLPRLLMLQPALHLGLRRQPGWPQGLLVVLLRQMGTKPPCACGGPCTRGRSILHRTSHIGSTTDLFGVARCRARSRNAGSGSHPQVHMAARPRGVARTSHVASPKRAGSLAPRMRSRSRPALAGPVGTQRSGHCICSEQWQAASREGRHGGKDCEVEKIASGASQKSLV